MPESEGMINSKSNILGYPCEQIGRNVPYFELLEDIKTNNSDAVENFTINDYLWKVSEKLNN